MTEEAFEARFRTEWEKYKRERNERLHRFTVRALIIFACLGLTTAVTVGYVAHTSSENKRALCAYQEDLDSRIAQTEQFLKENPDGIPGIPGPTIRANLSNQKSVAEAFSGISCP